jgi:hypothetical protein
MQAKHRLITDAPWDIQQWKVLYLITLSLLLLEDSSQLCIQDHFYVTISLRRGSFRKPPAVSGIHSNLAWEKHDDMEW